MTEIGILQEVQLYIDVMLKALCQTTGIIAPDMGPWHQVQGLQSSGHVL